jgi:hypothetical protein
MSRTPIQHLDSEQLMDAYYGERDASEHLATCAECRDQFERLREMLDAFREYPVPGRDDGYGSAVWTRLLPQLPASGRRWRSLLRWWMLTPAFAALLVVAFLGGRLAEHSTPNGPTQKARERVLLMSLSDHLEQAQIVLANVANASPDAADLGDERDRAHELLGANRLLRQTAARLGDMTDASLLEELERVLLAVANSPNRLAPIELERTQYQIEREGLLFRVRVTSVASRERGERL